MRLDAPPQAVEVLAYLIGERDRAVGRAELLDRFWPRAGTGGDAALNTCIRRIRALLDDDAELPRYIQTRPRLGYRFVGSIVDDLPSPMPSPIARRAAAGGIFAATMLAGAVWAQANLVTPRHAVLIEPARGLCEYVMFPKFNSGLQESFQSQASNRLPAGYELVTSGEGADINAEVSVRQTPVRTVVTLTLVRNRDGKILLSQEFAAPTDQSDYVPVQRDLARRMAIAMTSALGQLA